MTILRRAFRVSGAIVLALGVGCSLAVDASDIDAHCPSGRKFCEGRCVSHDDPAFGCKEEGCTPCSAIPNAFPSCYLGTCSASHCVLGFGCKDCEQNLLTSRENCGQCLNACRWNEVCQDGRCTVGPL